MSEEQAIEGDGESTTTHATQASGSSTKEKVEKADKYLGQIKGFAESAATLNSDIDAGHKFAAEAKIEIEACVNAARELVASLNQRHEDVKKLLEESQQSYASLTALLDVDIPPAKEAAVALARESAAIDSIKLEVSKAQEAIAVKSQYIEDARLHADDTQQKLNEALAAAQQSTANTEAQHAASRAILENLSSLHADAQGTKVTIDSHGEAVSAVRKTCENHATITKELSDKALAVEEILKGYEASLVELNDKAAEQLRRIEGLLPGAASAGMASAFSKRKDQFRAPQRWWQGVFIASILGLFVIAIASLWQQTGGSGSDGTWQGLWLSIFHRLPLALPLIWLAVHASHKGALAQRVEEDYGFKETVSRSFEGYRREMAELEGTENEGSPLSLLCEGVLTAITTPPGRIYEKHALAKTPLNALAEATDALGAEAKQNSKRKKKQQSPLNEPAT